MFRYAGFLRGVNVGGRKIAMGPLREALREAGFDPVRTLLNSGNVVLSSDGDANGTAAAIERVIADTFAMDVQTIVRTPRDLDQVLRLDPLGAVAENASRYLVMFMDRPPERSAVEALLAEDVSPDRVAISGREAYLYHPNGVSEAVLTHHRLERRLGVSGTARNWNTVSKIREVLHAP